MIAADTLEAIRTVAAALGELRQEVMFVGGAVAGYFVTDPAAPSQRPTLDIDVAIDVSAYPYVRLVERLRELGFTEDTSAPMWRWLVHGIRVDVMPAGPPGPPARWYAEALAHTEVVGLGSELFARVISAPYFLATKLDAFGDGRRGDYFSSRDIEDIVTVVDGRATIAADVLSSPPTVRTYLIESFTALLADRDFVDAVAGHLPGDSASQARLPLVLSRMRAIAAPA